MKRAFVFQPFLLLLYPILMTYNHNIGYLTLNVLFRPIIVALCCVLVLLLLAMLFIRDIHKAGIFITLIILLFFCSLPFCEQVDGWANSRTSVLIIKCLAVLISLVYLALFAYGIIKMRKQIALNIAIVMNTIVIVLVLFPVFNIGEHEFHKRQIWKHDRLIKEIKNGTASTENGKLPNIFYVILDGYARNDVLKEIYDYDNSEFWDYLNNKGFYIATRARSNYNQTALSLASSLNMDYLNDLLIDIDNNSSDRYLLYSLIRHNDVIRFLQQYGYKFVTFSSPFAAVDIKNSDIYKPTGFHLNELENCLIKGTVLSALSKKLVFLNQYDLHRQTILRTFSCLADMAQCEGPYFIYAHIAAPHPPFVFDKEGGKTIPKREFSFNEGNAFGGTKNEYREGYKDQLIFITGRMESVIDSIISKSKTPPVIIVQADHGPGSLFNMENLEDTYLKERFSIVEAYYLPGGDHKNLYESITPVNTFRLIFNMYYGTDYDLLEDRNYFSRWSHPYECIDVTEAVDKEIDMKQI